MRCRIPYLAFVVALGTVPAVATDLDAPLHRPPYGGEPLRFQAPPSQLLTPWRCGGIDVYGRPLVERGCFYDPRFAPDFLLDPFVTPRLMPPLRPVPHTYQPDATSPGVPFTGAPPTQLPKTHPAILFPIFER